MSAATEKRSAKLRISIYVFAIFWLIISAFPFIWTLWGSFKVELDFFSIADWTFALTGERTTAEYGRAFTAAGYEGAWVCLLYTSPSPRDQRGSRMPSSA